MKFRPLTLRGQTVLLVGSSLVLFYVLSLLLYLFFSISTATLEREEQITDRIVSIATLIDHAGPIEKPYLAGELSAPTFQVNVDSEPLVDPLNHNAVTIVDLIADRLKTARSAVSAGYVHEHVTWKVTPDAPRRQETFDQYIRDLLRIHELLEVSVQLEDGNWLNFRISGSAWDHIFSFAAIPSMALAGFGTILLAAWAVTRPLDSITRLARASDDLATDVLNALPVDERGPKEIREAAQAFNQMQTQIQRLLQARNEMLGAISHDFRTPLTRLRIRIEELPDEAQRLKAIRDLDEMETMIRHALAYARDEATEVHESVDVAALLKDLLSDFDDHVVLNEPAATASHCIHGQTAGLRRVFSNIIENARFYGERVCVDIHNENGNVIVEIDDDGPGVEEQYRERVFIPFYRMESSRSRETGGAGLGLSIAQNIVHANGGSIELLDSPMGGLRVRIVFPEETRTTSRPS